MSKFILMFLAIYGGMHAYLVWRVHRAFPHSRAALIGAVVFSVIMMALPILGRRLEDRLGEWFGAILMLFAFTWTFWLFWFLMMGVAFDAWNLSMRGLALRWERPSAFIVPPGKALIACCAIILLASVWGLVEASRIKVREVDIPTARLTPGEDAIRIVQISDVHLGVTMPLNRFRRVVDTVRALEPDVLVDTGDFVDALPESLGEHLALIEAIKPPMGKYAVAGNHEFYVGMDKIEEVHRKTGFELLRGRHVRVGGDRLILAGVDDPTARRTEATSYLDEDAALPPFDPDGPPVVLLKHIPNIDSTVVGRYDAQLSGHIHGGQVWPFRYFVKLQFDYGVGLHELSEGWLSVSPGTGSWGTPMRVGSPPRIMLIRLVPDG